MTDFARSFDQDFARNFTPELRELARGLRGVPEPGRSRFLLELRGDLEDLAAALRDEGAGPEEARRRAVATLLPDPDSAAALARVHRSLYQRLVDRFSVPTRNRLERALLAGLVAVMAVGGVATLAVVDLLRDPSPFLWPVLALGGTTLAVGVARLATLFVKKDHDPARLDRGMFVLPVGAAATVALACGGTVIDLYRMAGRIERDVTTAVPHVLAWLRQDTALLAVALALTSFAFLAWFLASIRIAGIVQAEAEVFSNPNQGGT